MTSLVDRRVKYAGLVALVLLGAPFACSSSATSTPPIASDVPDASTDSIGEAGSSPCETLTTASTVDCGALSWAVSPTASRLRNHHLSVVARTPAGPFLFVVGGANEASVLGNVDRAAINPDGSLGAFTSAGAIPKKTGGMTGAIVSGVLVFAGGNTGSITDLSYAAVVQPDGTLGPWTSSGSTKHKRMHAGSATNASSFYVLGGFEGTDVWDDIVRATVSETGTVGEWTAAGTMPRRRSHFASAQVDRYVYLTGGLDKPAGGSPPPLRDVSRGTLKDDGTIGDWMAMPSLPVSLCTHASFVYGGYVYVGGGLSEDTYDHEKRIWRAQVQADFTLGAWEQAAPLPSPRGHVHQMPVFGTHVYFVAGAVNFDLASSSEIDIGSFL